jgi:hypothetical protein
MLQDHFLGFGMFDLILFDDIVLVDRLHGKDFFGFLSLNKKNSSKGAPTEYNLGRKVIKRDFLLEIFLRKERFSGPPYHFLFLFLALQILLIRQIIVHHIIALHLFGALFLLFLFGSRIMHQAQLVLVIDGQLVILDLPVGLKYVVDDLLPAVGRGIPKVGNDVPVVIF